MKRKVGALTSKWFAFACCRSEVYRILYTHSLNVLQLTVILHKHVCCWTVFFISCATSLDLIIVYVTCSLRHNFGSRSFSFPQMLKLREFARFPLVLPSNVLSSLHAIFFLCSRYVKFTFWRRKKRSLAFTGQITVFDHIHTSTSQLKG